MDLPEESKVSSSSFQTRKLGELLKPPVHTFQLEPLGNDRTSISIPGGAKNRLVHPFVIGLTGGSGCGKTSVARIMHEDHGICVVDCDKLGQVAYATPDTPCYSEMVEKFGHEIVDPETRLILRPKVGQIVFQNKNKLNLLNEIVWPHIEKAAHAQIRQHLADLEPICQKYYFTRNNSNSNPPTLPKGVVFQKKTNTFLAVIALDAAVLLEASWGCDEIWVVFVEREEQVKRIMERDKKTREETEARLNAQMSNETRIEQANVLLTTMWEPVKTRRFVKNAVDKLMVRLGGDNLLGEESAKL